MLDPAVFIKWGENFEESVSYQNYPRLSFSTRCLMIWALELQCQQSLLSRTLECFIWKSWKNRKSAWMRVCVGGWGGGDFINNPRNIDGGGGAVVKSGRFKTRHWMSQPRVLPPVALGWPWLLRRSSVHSPPLRVAWKWRMESSDRAQPFLLLTEKGGPGGLRIRPALHRMWPCIMGTVWPGVC